MKVGLRDLQSSSQSWALLYCESILVAVGHGPYGWHWVNGLMEWSAVLACPSLVCFFDRGNAEKTGSSGGLCLMFIFCFVWFVSGLSLWFLDGLWFDSLHAK